MSNGTRTGQRSLVGLLIALIAAAVLWWTQGDGNTPQAEPAPSDTPSVQQTAGESETDVIDAESGLPIVRLSDLPPEAAETLALIDAGGPFREDEDGSTFGNREDILPQRAEGYYEEYTVPTPGSDDRGARRIVTGSGGELFWTADHYSSFSRIAR